MKFCHLKISPPTSVANIDVNVFKWQSYYTTRIAKSKNQITYITSEMGSSINSRFGGMEQAKDSEQQQKSHFLRQGLFVWPIGMLLWHFHIGPESVLKSSIEAQIWVNDPMFFIFKIGLMVILDSTVYKHAGNIFQSSKIHLNQLKWSDNSRNLQFG